MSNNFEFQDKMRIVQELVPGKQITIAHTILGFIGLEHEQPPLPGKYP